MKQFLVLFFLRFIPKNHLSALVGKLVHIPLPSKLSLICLRWFIRTFGVNVEEAAQDVSSYRCLGDFFVRELKVGLRSLQEGVVSPVDGTIVEYGALAEDQLLQIKGKAYSVFSLVGEQELGSRFVNGFFITFYLAPRDYHHVHSPLGGKITSTYHIPGALWPVNSWSVNRIDNLFSTNERMVTVLESSAHCMGLVCVGATNVGAIQLSYDTLQANQDLRWFQRRKIQKMVHKVYVPPIAVHKGDKVATFAMGSTVILLFQRAQFLPGTQCVRGPIQLGRSLGEMAVTS